MIETNPVETIPTLSSGADGGPQIGLTAAALQKLRANKVSENPWLVCGLAALCLWSVIFAIGVSVPSSPLRNSVIDRLVSWAAGTQAPVNDRQISVFGAVVLIFMSFTPTNAFLLGLLSGLIGGCSSRLASAAVMNSQSPDLPADFQDDLLYLRENPLASMLRAFVVYALILAGIYVTLGSSFTTPTPEQYLKLAGVVTAVCFAAGYNPRLFKKLLLLIPTK